MTGDAPYKVAIVDDNPISVRLAGYVLESEGFVVRAAASAPAALQLVPDWRPDLVLMDLQMPGMSGLELTRLLKSDQNTADIVIVALSAYVRSEDRERAREAGCDGFIAKPIDTREFPAQVASFIKRAI